MLSLQHTTATGYHQITDISLTYSVYDNTLSISNAISLNYDVTAKWDVNVKCVKRDKLQTADISCVVQNF
jgi:hypothetical protein